MGRREEGRGSVKKRKVKNIGRKKEGYIKTGNVFLRNFCV